MESVLIDNGNARIMQRALIYISEKMISFRQISHRLIYIDQRNMLNAGIFQKHPRASKPSPPPIISTRFGLATEDRAEVDNVS